MERRCRLAGLDAPVFVDEATVHEALSQPTRATVVVRLDDELDIEAALDKPVVLELLEDDTVVRAFHLVVRQAQDDGYRSEGRRYTLELRDAYGMLALRRDLRIFQNKTTKEIVAAVFDGAGLDANAVSWSVQRGLPKRVYCVQYREPDLTFVERLLAHEGIFSIPADEPDSPKRTFADDASAFAAIEGEATLPLSDQGAGAGIEGLQIDYHLTTDEIVLRDWNYETPRVDLTATARLAATPQYSSYEFPGGYSTPADGNALANIRADEIASRQTVAHGKSHHWPFRPGRLFTLEGATRSELNVQWLLRAVTHRFRWHSDEAVYQNEFEAAPKDQPYRPPRTHPRPIVRGSHSIEVTGPSGEEIHTDSLGRMKGKFFWDRVGHEDAEASCWMRTLQLPIGGSQALARIGWEMIVRYAYGDPDRPTALFRADNAIHPAPYAYPKAASGMSFKTHSSPSSGKFNELTMEDGGGGMKFGVTAAKDWNEQVNNNKTEKIGVDEKLDVGTDLATTVGASQTIKIGANRTVTIGDDAGVTIGADRTKSVGASETVSISGSLSEKVTGSDTETVGASHTSVAALGVSRTSKGSHSLTVGGVMISVAGLGCAVSVAGAKSETVGGAKLVISGGPASESVYGACAVTVGGACVHAASGNRLGTAKGSSRLLVGGVALINAASKLQMKAKKIKITVAGVANLLGGGGILNLTPGSASFVGLVSVKGSSAIKILGAPNLVG